MKSEAFYTMEHGTHLLLKPNNRYGMDAWQPLMFDHIQPRPGYSVPWIVAYWQTGIPGGEKVGHFKPSDFKGLYHTQLEKNP